MTTPNPPHDVHVEMFLAGAWTDVSQYVYQRQAMELTRGRTSESDAVQPASLKLTLDNRTGNFSPRNPRSPYYGQFGRNTPIRVAVRQFNDTFTRSVSGGWGTTGSGSVWSTDGNGGTVQASDFNVTGAVATHNLPAASAWRGSFFTAANDTVVDVTGKVDFSFPFSTPAGGSVQAGVLLRYNNTTKTGYLVTVQVTTTPQVLLQIYRVSSASSTVLLKSLTTALTNTANTLLSVRGQIEDQTIRGSVWLASAGEPKDWMLSTVDATYPAGAWCGVRSDTGSGNTNVPFTVTYDNFEGRHARFRGEISAWPQTWDQSGKDITIALEAAGPFRRLNQGTTPTISAPRAYIPTTNPIHYWPLEDLGTLTLAGVPAVGTAPFAQQGTGTQKWGQGQLAAWLTPALQGITYVNATSLDGKFAARLDPTLYGAGGDGTITMDYLVSGVNGHQAVLTNDSSPFTILGWILGFDPTRTPPGLLSPPVGFGLSSTVVPGYIFSNDLYHIRFSLDDLTGGNVSWSVYINGVVMASGTYSAPGLGFFPNSPVFAGIDTVVPPGSAGATIGHVAVYYGPAPSVSASVLAARGYPGEVAGNRIQRLCAASNITFTNVGNLLATKPLGPQQATSVLTLLTDAASADRGILAEARGDLALTYRPISAIYNAPIAAALDVTQNHHLSGPLSPVDDDRFVRNDVTITRSGGAAQRVTQPLGSLGTAPPPSGVGSYPDSATVNLLYDTDALQLAAWRVGIGTWDEARYPGIKSDFSVLPLNMRGALAALNIGQRLQISNPETWLPPDVIDLLVQGTSETLSRFVWNITITASPFGPYRVGILDSTTQGLLDTSGSTLTSGITSSATSMSVTTTTGPIWIQGAVNFDIRVAGERITVTNISGAASPQTFTVTRSVNGISKAQVAGTAVSLWQPLYLAY